MHVVHAQEAEGAEPAEPDKAGGFDDQYDMDDEFIDDTEFHDYYSGDRRRTKYTGFFINRVRRSRPAGKRQCFCPWLPCGYS